MLKKLIIYFFVIVLSISCSSSGVPSFRDLKYDEYEKVGSEISEEKLLITFAECEVKGEQKRTTMGLGGLAGIASIHESRNRVIDACMRSKGFKLKEK